MPNTRQPATPNASRVLDELTASEQYSIEAFHDSYGTDWTKAEHSSLNGILRILTNPEEGVQVYAFTHNYTLRFSMAYDASVPASIVMAAINATERVA